MDATLARPKAAGNAASRGRWLRRIVVMLVSAGVAVLGIEYYLRHKLGDFFGPAAYYAALYRLDSAGEVDVVPGHAFEMRIGGRTTSAHVNSIGLRGAELPPKPPGAVGLLGVGDSMVFGVGVNDDETFTVRLGEHLGRALQRPVVARTAGAPGYSTFDQVRALQRVRQRFAADVIVSGVFIANDFEDNFTAPRTVVDGHLLVGPFAAMAATSWRGRFALRCRTAFVVEHFLRQHLPGLALQIPAPDPGTFADFPADRSMGLFLDAREETPALARILDRWEQAMRELLAVAAPTPVIAVLLPDRLRALPRDYRAALPRHGLSESTHTAGQVELRLLARCAKLGLEAVDLVPVFQADADAARLFIDDMHYSAAGHQLAADALAPVVTRRLR